MRALRWSTKVPILAIIGTIIFFIPCFFYNDLYTFLCICIGGLLILIDLLYYTIRKLRSRAFEKSKINIIASFMFFPFVLMLILIGFVALFFAFDRTKKSYIEKLDYGKFDSHLNIGEYESYFDFIFEKELEIVSIDEEKKEISFKATTTITIPESKFCIITYTETRGSIIDSFTLNGIMVTPEIKEKDGYREYIYRFNTLSDDKVVVEFSDIVKYDLAGKYMVCRIDNDDYATLPEGFEIIHKVPRGSYFVSEGIPEKYTQKGYNFFNALKYASLGILGGIVLIPVVKIVSYPIYKLKFKDEEE